MQSDVRSMLYECTTGSDEERLTFPQLIARLSEIGVEGYYSDLRRAEKTYYLSKGTGSHVVQTTGVGATVASTFSAPEVRSAVRAVGCRKITYLKFCELLAAAGCVGYFVSLTAQRIVYYGKRGDSLVEQFTAMG
jgi:uncharacterized protein YbcV (DUF1398 family)